MMTPHLPVNNPKARNQRANEFTHSFHYWLVPLLERSSQTGKVGPWAQERGTRDLPLLHANKVCLFRSSIDPHPMKQPRNGHNSEISYTIGSQRVVYSSNWLIRFTSLLASYPMLYKKGWKSLGIHNLGNTETHYNVFFICLKDAVMMQCTSTDS